MSSSITRETGKDNIFKQTKSDIAYISEESTPLIDAFKDELSKTANFVDIPDETEALQDALYYRSVSYILRVPEGFTEKFMAGEDVKLEKTVVPNSYANAYLDLSIDKYFNTARLYINQIPDISQESLAEHLKSDLSAGTAVEMQTTAAKPENFIYTNYYFNYLAYSMLSVLILGMSALMLVFNDRDLKKRNACSPVSANSVNLHFILSCILFTFVTWLIMIVFCFVFNYKNGFGMNSLYLIMNSFIFAVCGASISYLIGNLVTGPSAVPAISNVVTLGLSFISGVFVPQEFLGSSVLKIASFTPTYWYVKTNNMIAELRQFDISHVEPILSNMLIVLTFTLAFFVVALVIGKKRRFQ
jgi:ABC-2 type transport system permease protein